MSRRYDAVRSLADDLVETIAVRWQWLVEYGWENMVTSAREGENGEDRHLRRATWTGSGWIDGRINSDKDRGGSWGSVTTYKGAHFYSFTVG